MSNRIDKKTLERCVDLLNLEVYLHWKQQGVSKEKLDEHVGFYSVNYAFGGCQLVNKLGNTLSGFESKRAIWQRVQAMRNVVYDCKKVCVCR